MDSARLLVTGGAFVALVAPASAHAQCAAPALPVELVRGALAVEQAWVSMNVEGVVSGAESLQAMIPCLGAPLDPDAAARVHRALGLALVASGDREAAAQAFASARHASPALGISDALAPEGTPVRDLFDRPVPYVEPITLTPPTRGFLLLDGTATDRRPGARPTLLQHLSPGGEVDGSWLLRPGESLPEDPWADPRRPVRVGLRAGTIGLAAASATVLGVAAWTHSVHQDPTRTELSLSDLDQLRQRTHTLTVTGGVLGAVAATGFGVSVSGVLR